MNPAETTAGAAAEDIESLKSVWNDTGRSVRQLLLYDHWVKMGVLNGWTKEHVAELALRCECTPAELLFGVAAVPVEKEAWTQSGFLKGSVALHLHLFSQFLLRRTMSKKPIVPYNLIIQTRKGATIT
jgi:hypothetical protein